MTTATARLSLLEEVRELRKQVAAVGVATDTMTRAEWDIVKAEMLDALTPFPEARAAVAARLVTMTVESGHR